MSFFVQIGKTPSLSLIELKSLIPEANFSHSDSAIITFHSVEQCSLDELVRWSGGLVSAGMVLKESVVDDQLGSVLEELIFKDTRSIAVSVFDDNAFSLKELVGQVKKRLQARGHAIRYVMPNPPMQTVRSVALMHEMKEGRFEHFALWRSKDGWSVGRTEVIQSVNEWAWIDSSKPSRRIKQGMLPAKVARMMLNLGLAKISDRSITPVVLDPFCGTGTVLLEALRLGCIARGIDLVPDAVASAEHNLKWLVDNLFRGADASYVDRQVHPFLKYPFAPVDVQRYKVQVGDAVHLDEVLTAKSVDLVVTEPYMGSLMTGIPDRLTAQNKAKGLLKLYLGFFKALRFTLKPGGVVVFTLPFYRLRGEEVRIPLIDRLARVGYNPIIPAIDYFSDDTIVGREIITVRLEN